VYSKSDYPDSLKNLEPKVRNKAIEIINSMIEDGYDESRAIPIATKKAKEWADENSDASGETEQHVLPHENGWAVKKKDADRPAYTFETKEEAVDKARELSKNQEAVIVVHKKDGSVEKEIGPLT
jgi:uncharacterized protein YdaT